MELDDIRRNAIAARQFEAVVDGVTFTLRVPTKLEASIAYMESTGSTSASSQLRWQRALLVLAIVGWSGLRIAHVLLDTDGAFEFELRPWHWDRRCVWFLR